MDSFIASEVVERLKLDYSFKKEVKGWLRYGVCPFCDKKELFVRADSPWKVKCGRENSCGKEIKTQELYPEIFAGFNKRNPPTPKNPNATADAYMRQARRFDISKIKGWYEQGQFWHPHGDKGTATVRFYLNDEKSIHMERLVEDVTINDPEKGEKEKRKAHFQGAYAGLWWHPPKFKIKKDDTIWLVEGIIDAISLNLNGIKAMAILSCGNYPENGLQKHKDKNITWVVALDNDAAGRKYTTNDKHTGHVDKMLASGFTARAAQIPGKTKRDWNDLHNKKLINDKLISQCLYHGDLLLAKSSTDKALLMYKQTERSYFYFDFKNSIYWFTLNLKKYSELKEEYDEKEKDLTDLERRDKALKGSNSIKEIANCNISFLYFLQNKQTDESWFYARISYPKSNRTVKDTFTASQLANAGEFKKRLMHTSGGKMYTGNSGQLEIMLKNQLDNLKHVNTIDYIGYSKEYGCYVFNDIAIKDGIKYDLNDEDYFDCEDLPIKSLSQSVALDINKNRDKNSTEWVSMLCKCFGTKGVATLAFWLGSLFAEQIRAKHKSYPFLEAIGDPGAGKSTIIEFLWKLVGRIDYEGFDPNKSSSPGIARTLSQVSNLPVSFIEADRSESASKFKVFDWDNLKPLYNGRAPFTRGIKNGGNETYEPPFRGSIIISQNAALKASPATLERIVHIKYTKENHTPETVELANEFKTLPIEKVSHFIIDAVCKEAEILELFFEKQKEYERQLTGNELINIQRVALTHSQIMALVDCLALVIPLSEKAIKATHVQLEVMAEEREKACSQDHPIVQEFWSSFDYLNHRQLSLDHSNKKETIAINLNHFAEVARNHNQEIPDMSELKKHLQTSQSRKYQGQAAVASKLVKNDQGNKKTMKCWIFDNSTSEQGARA